MVGHGGRGRILHDGNWNEVGFMNTYSVFMGYLSMAIRGLGFLVLTWTTVVLLGGFVSMLHKKDFWCLTFITLAQTAGIFDVLLNEKLSYIVKSLFGLLGIVYLGVMGDDSRHSNVTYTQLVRFLVGCVLMVVQLVVLAALFCPLAIIYVFGIFMSGGISLWRLVERDYKQGNSDEEISNLVPAMDTLYCLALLQGVIFCYRFMLGCTVKRISKEVAVECDDSQLQLVSNYFHETMTQCEKDPAFAKGRNLITHAVDMIGSSSPVDCISGVKILYTAICIVETELKLRLVEGRQGRDSYHQTKEIFIGKHMLMKHLVVSASSSRHVLYKLLETLDSRGLHDRETRHQAAMIVERLAFNINLEHFPRGIQHLSSLLGTFEEYSIVEPYQRDYLYDAYEQTWKLHARCLPLSPASSGDDARSELEKAYKELLLQGLSIIGKLSADKNNCKAMSDTPELVSKIMGPVTSDLLHHTTDDHGAWSDVVEGSMRVMAQLNSAMGETGAKLRREISSCEEAINTLQRIFSCNECNEGLKLHAISILTQLYMDVERSRSTDFIVLKKESREDFVRKLVGMFTHPNKSISVRAYAGGALSMLCFHGGVSDATIVIKATGDVVVSLSNILVQDKNLACRQSAAEILEHLCTFYTKDDEYLGKLKKSMTDVMPQMLGEILRYGDEKGKGKEGDQCRFTKPKTDIENQHNNAGGKGTIPSSCSHPRNDEQDEEEKAFQSVLHSVGSANLLSSLLSLCVTVLIGKLCQDLAPQFVASRFLNKLKEMLVEKSDLTVESLLLFKAITKMVISMMKHSGGGMKQEELASLIEALSGASKNMLGLDHSMVFSSTDSSSATTSAQLDRRTLASLVREAQDLHVRLSSTSVAH